MHITPTNHATTPAQAKKPAANDKSILQTLAYFDMFAYPLTGAEIKLFLGQAVTDGDLHESLRALQEEQKVFYFDGLYALRNEPQLITRRREGNARAAILLQKARKISSFLYWFPYVRGIGISGSLSKNFAAKDSDIDFFIITRANRLWIARTCMHLFKKLTFLTRSQHLFCMNYYIDELALAIGEQNIFTATEVITLVPADGNGTLTKFFTANRWVHDYFPNQPPKTGNPGKPREGYIKRMIEYCFDNKLGERLDDLLLRITANRWRRKEAHGRQNARGGRMGLTTGKHFARPNPAFFQRDILQLYNSKLKQAETA